MGWADMGRYLLPGLYEKINKINDLRDQSRSRDDILAATNDPKTPTPPLENYNNPVIWGHTRDTVQKITAQPVLNQLSDFKNRGWGSDPSFSGQEWTEGLLTTPQFSNTDQMPDMKNPNIAKGVSDFASQAQHESDLSNLFSGGKDASLLARLTAGESGQGINAIRQLKESVNPTNTIDTVTPANRAALEMLPDLYKAATPEEQAGVLAKIVKANPGADPKFLHDILKQGQRQYVADKPEPNATEEQLTARALKGDKEAQSILDALYKRKGDLARQNRAIIQQTPTRNVNINGLSDEENAALGRAIDNGLDPYKVNSRTAKIYAQQEMRQPGRAWNKLGAEAAFERSQSTMNTKALLNTIDPLLDKLEQSGAILGNSRLPGYNKAINFLKEQTGSADIVGFNNLRDDVVAEVERGLLGTGVLSDSKYNRAIKNINSAQSLPQLKAAIANTRAVIAARLEALAKGPNAKPTGKKTVVKKFVSPSTGKTKYVYSDGSEEIR